MKRIWAALVSLLEPNSPISRKMLKLHVRSSAAILAVLMCLLAASCNKTPEQSGVQEPNSDPAQANLAAPEAAQGQETQYAAPPQQQTPNQRVQRSYREEPSTQASYPPLSGSTDQNYRQNDDYNTYDNDSAEPAVEAEQAPPPLPQYSQPECPGENYIWTRGTGRTRPPAIIGYPAHG